MEADFNFETQVCTSKEQSEHLLSLGIKTETADCYLYIDSEGITPVVRPYCEIMEKLDILPFDAEIVPAWSLHRLIKIGFHKGIGIVPSNNAFGCVISIMEKRIQNGVFNKNYLK